ncbi:restriction endonuclease subunit S [Rhodoplanes sp. SY1]|uniref:restriction endonuclease subunit S n=1 Tax=Rhodoplanes sp. SY1 TaxID=3166646 RepID=UPI0038B438D6
MIEGLRPYPDMKPTGLAWLPEVPAHWDVRRNGRLFGIRKETRYPDLPILEVSLRTGVRVRDLENGPRKQQMTDRSKYQRAAKGDLAYNMMRMWQGAVGVVPTDGLVSPAYVVVRPREDTFAPYFANLFRTAAYMREVETYSRGIVPDRNRLYWESFKQITCCVPPAEEQQLIVQFLDWHGAQTAKLIRAKKKLITLLNEQRQLIIRRAVTGGFDAAVARKPSGTDWLGQVPEHWQVKRLKWATRLQRGYDLPAERRVSGPYPVVSSGGVIDHHAETRSRGPGVVMGRYGSTNAVFYIEKDFWPHNTSLFVTNFHNNYRLWCYYLLCTISKADHSGKSAVPGVDRKDLFDIIVPVPPYEEQIAIVRGIERLSQELNETISRFEHEVALVQELRMRLIADVVTGKLDVRAAAASLPETTEVETVEDLDEDDLEESVGEVDTEEAAV